MSEAQLPITGYLDRLSGRPGDRVTAHVGVRNPGHYQATLVRVVSADPNPAGPGMRFDRLDHVFSERRYGTSQPINPGSYGTAPSPPRPVGRATTWTLLFRTAVFGDQRTLLSDEGPHGSVSLGVSAAGLVATITGPWSSSAVVLTWRMRPRIWHRAWISVDPARSRWILGLIDEDGRSASVAAVSPSALPECEDILFAAADRFAPRSHFTGKIEAPAVLAGFIEEWADWRVLPRDAVADAAWNFAAGIDGSAFGTAVPDHCEGRLVNMPTRGVVGSSWSGREHCWRAAPEDYAAVHFHSDDIDDCRWAPSFEFDVPTDLPSGAYAFHLSHADGEDWLPFYCLAALEGPHAAVVFLAPTFTYTAYANSGWNNRSEKCHARNREWGGSGYWQARYPGYGRSTYDTHDDGSGVSLSSRLRPMPSMRPGFLSYFDENGSGVRHYPADSHILGWLADKGIAFDVVTDEDLHDEGAALLAPYKLVLTATHPEYQTEQTLDALTAHVVGGGRLAYLGGNGFYWKVARRADIPHMIEVRRAEGGIRTWAAEPGEYHHQLDGAMGGLWRRSRRPPQRLVGVGFAAQGPYEAGHYRRTEASYGADVAWILDGADQEFGDYGLCAGGAAGFELDRADVTQGTPEQTVVLASSIGLPPGFVPVHEEMLTDALPLSAKSVDEVVRADMVFFENERGGAVFATGSITFCGSLWNGNAFDGPVSHILENVVCRLSR